MTGTDEKLTVLLPLKGRENFTLRWLSWARRQQWRFPIIIADGSEQAVPQEFLRAFEDLSITYIRYPHDATLRHFLEKLADAYSRVETPYTVLVSNDDFLLKQGLQQCVDFLESHDNHIAAAGDLQTFLVQPSHTSPGMVPLYGSFEATPHTNYPGKSLEHETPTERLDEYVRKHFNSFLWTAVHRTKPVLDTWQTLARSGLNDLRFACHAYYLMSVAKGSIGHVSTLTGLLQTNPGNSEGHNIVSRHSGWWGWFQTEGWDHDFNIFVSLVAEVAACVEGYSKPELSEHVARLYLESLGTNLLRKTWPETHRKMLPQVPQQTASAEQFVQEVASFLETAESTFVADTLARQLKSRNHVLSRGKQRFASSLKALRSMLFPGRTL